MSGELIQWLDVAPVLRPLDARMKRGGYRVRRPFYLDGLDVWLLLFFDYDGATIPRACWPIVGSPFDAEVMRAAAGHDLGYWLRLWPKRELDDWFRETMVADGVAKWRADAMHRAVRAFGGHFYQRRPEDVAYARAWMREFGSLCVDGITEGVELVLRGFPEIEAEWGFDAGLGEV
jgi:hypothetical protein